MSKRQTRNMLRLMARGEPVELTSPMASVKKLSRLAFVAQQFGYEYADVRQGGGSGGSALRMLIVPDPSPQARARAAQNWARYPDAHDGVSLPPLVRDAFDLLKTRITFDLTGRSAEKRMGYGALGATVGCVVLALRLGGKDTDFVTAAVTWVVLMALLGIGFAVNRRRHAGAAARLRAAGFVAVTDTTGRVRYLPPVEAAGHGRTPYGAGPPPQAPGPYQPPPHPAPYGPQPPYPQQQPYAPQPYPQQQPHPQQYGQAWPPSQPPSQQPPAPYSPPQPPPPYGQPPHAYGQPPHPYGQPPGS